jgi:hypothetical protein
MQIDLTASHDACQPSAFCQEDENILWLQPRSAMGSRSTSRGRKALLSLTTSIGLGACLSMAMGTAATEPAAAAEPQVASAPAANALLPTIKASESIQLPHSFTQPQTAPADPLQALAPVLAAPADPIELRKQIILSIPLTNPPASEGSEDEDEISVAVTDYLEFEEMRVPLWIVDTILRASKATGADPVYMMALADKESSFVPGNKASTSSAEGLFQFITSTWLETVRSFGPKHGLTMEAQAIQTVDGKLTVPDGVMREHILGLRRNPYLSALMAAEMMKRDQAKIEGRLGRKLSRSEFYLSHFFGVDSASKFIALVDDTPKKSAPSAFPAAAKSNKSLFYTKDGKKTRQLSVAEVYGKIDDMIDKRLNRYEDVSSRTTADASF